MEIKIYKLEISDKSFYLLHAFLDHPDIIDGSNYSPDFMYLVNDSENNTELHLVESKGIKQSNLLREIESDKITAAEKVYNLFECEGNKVKYVKQLDKDSITKIVKSLINN